MSLDHPYVRKPRRSSAGDVNFPLQAGYHDLAHRLLSVSPTTSASEAESDFDGKFVRLCGGADPRRSAIGDPVGSPLPEYPKPLSEAETKPTQPLFVKETVRAPVTSASFLTEALMPVDIMPMVRRNAHSFDFSRGKHKSPTSVIAAANAHLPPKHRHMTSDQSTIPDVVSNQEDIAVASSRYPRRRHRRASSLQDHIHDIPRRFAAKNSNYSDNRPQNPSIGTNSSDLGGGEDVGLSLSPKITPREPVDLAVINGGNIKNMIKQHSTDKNLNNNSNNKLDSNDSMMEEDYYDPDSLLSHPCESDVVDEGRIWQITQMLASATVGDVIRGVVRLCNVKGASYNLTRPYRAVKKKRVSGTLSSDPESTGRRSIVLSTPGRLKEMSGGALTTTATFGNNGVGIGDNANAFVVATALGDGQLLLPHGVDESGLGMDAIASASIVTPAQSSSAPVVNRDGLFGQPTVVNADKAIPTMFELRALDDGEPDMDVPELDRMQAMSSLGETAFALCKSNTKEFVLEIHVEPGHSSRGAAVMMISFRRPGQSAPTSSDSDAFPTNSRSHKETSSRLRQQERLLREREGSNNVARQDEAGLGGFASEEAPSSSETTKGAGDEDISFDEWYRREYGDKDADANVDHGIAELAAGDAIANAIANQPDKAASAPDKPPTPPTMPAELKPLETKKTILGLPFAGLPFWGAKSTRSTKAAEPAAENEDEYAGDVDETPQKTARPRTVRRGWDASSILRSPHVFFFGNKQVDEQDDSSTRKPDTPATTKSQTPAAVDGTGSSLPPSTTSRGLSFISAFNAFSPSRPPLHKPSQSGSSAAQASRDTPLSKAATDTPTAEKPKSSYFSNFFTPRRKSLPRTLESVQESGAEAQAEAPMREMQDLHHDSVADPVVEGGLSPPDLPPVVDMYDSDSSSSSEGSPIRLESLSFIRYSEDEVPDVG